MEREIVLPIERWQVVRLMHAMGLQTVLDGLFCGTFVTPDVSVILLVSHVERKMTAQLIENARLFDVRQPLWVCFACS